MARKQKAEAEPEAPAMLALIETPDVPAPTAVDQARIILLDAQKFDQFYDKVKGETDAHVPDVSTPAGRQAIKSLAFRVTKTHTTLKSASLELTEAWRKQTAAVNAARGPMIERLTKLAADVRQPLTEWEEAEAARVQANRDVIDGIRADAVVKDDDTAASVAERGRLVWAMAFDAPQWSEDEAVEAGDAKDATVAVLVAAQKRLKVEEAEKAELAALRAEREERIAREAAEQAERERVAAEEQAERERVERERQAQADAEEAERVRVAELERREREAADKARRDAEEAAAAAQRERDAAAERERAAERAEHERQLAAERAERERIEREAEVERQRIASEARAAEEARQREAEAIEAERQRVKAEKDEAARIDAERQANREHRGNVQREVKEAFMTCGISEDDARKVVLAIVAGNVPHCTVAF